MNEEQSEIKKLLEDNLAVVQDNNRLLKLIRRDAFIGLGVKIALYAVLFGLPLFFLSQYLGPLLESFSAGSGAASGAALGIPTNEQIELFKQTYGL